MVKVPLGAKVIIDLWDTRKKKGMVKFYDDTQYLVRGMSDFKLEKGDRALVVESEESFVHVVPFDRFTSVLKENRIDKINYSKLAHLIFKILQERERETGGIMQKDDLYELFQRSTIKSILKKKHLKKAIKLEEVPVERLKIKGVRYYALKPQLGSYDIQEVLKYAKDHSFITKEMIHKDKGWNNLRIERLLNYLVKYDYCRKDESYRTGIHYYFQNLEK